MKVQKFKHNNLTKDGHFVDKDCVTIVNQLDTVCVKGRMFLAKDKNNDICLSVAAPWEGYTPKSELGFVEGIVITFDNYAEFGKFMCAEEVEGT